MSGDAERVIQRLASTLAQSVPGGAAEQGDTTAARLWVGKITAKVASTPASYTVTMDGTNTRADVRALVSLAVNDIVWILEQPPMLLILGKSV